MSKLHRPWLKAATLGFFALIIFTAAPGSTRADEIVFDASTAGCFDPPACTSSSLLGLSFTGSNFSGTSGEGTSEDGVFFNTGFLPLNNLGTFTLTPDLNNYNGNQFQVRITFNTPGSLVGGQTVALTADLLSNRTGVVIVNFDNTPVPFTVEIPGTLSGSFQLAIFDLFLVPGSTGLAPGSLSSPSVLTGTLRGEITNAGQGGFGSQVPEPATLGLLATGLSGLAGLARRRRKRALSSK